jgi:hypothetical protein
VQRRFEELCQAEPRLRALREKSATVKDDPTKESFCANWHWYRRGGLKSELLTLVGWETERSELRSSDDYDVAYHEIYNQLPNCRNCTCF